MSTDVHFQGGHYPDPAAMLTSELRDELKKVTAERDRLKAVLRAIEQGDYYGCVSEFAAKALGGDAS